MTDDGAFDPYCYVLDTDKAERKPGESIAGKCKEALGKLKQKCKQAWSKFVALLRE